MGGTSPCNTRAHTSDKFTNIQSHNNIKTIQKKKKKKNQKYIYINTNDNLLFCKRYVLHRVQIFNFGFAEHLEFSLF